MLKQVLRRLMWELRMSGRLFKYDMVYFFRFVPILYAVMLGCAMFGAFSSWFTPVVESGADASAIFVLAVMIWMLAVMALFVVTFIVIVLRFRDNLLRDPAYLMLTLPVSPWTLIAGKIFSAVVLFVLGYAVSAVSLWIFLRNPGIAYNFGDFLDDISGHLNYVWNLYLLQGGNKSTLALAVSAVALDSLSGLVLFFACIVAANLVPRLRVLVVIGLWIVVQQVIERPLAALLIRQTYWQDLWMSDKTTDEYLLDTFHQVIQTLPAVITLTVVLSLIYFWAAGFLLKRTLNVD